MKKLLLFSVLIYLTFSFTGCKKDEPIIPKPKAEFTFTIGANGKVIFQNFSTDADTYSWTLGDGSTNSSSNYFTYQYTQNRSWQVSLTAIGKGGRDVIVKTIPISNILGNLLIYKKFSTRDRNINVYVDGNFVGTINGSYYNAPAPSCGNSVSVTAYNLSPGSHKVEAKETGLFPYSWNYYADVVGGICNSSGLTL